MLQRASAVTSTEAPLQVEGAIAMKQVSPMKGLKKVLALGLGLVPMVSWAWWPAPAPQPTNTNACVSDLAGIAACADTGLLGLPKDLHGCCAGVRELARDRCECNPAIDTLLGTAGQQIYELEPLCRLAEPLKWVTITPRVLRTCTSLNRHDYGCGPNDMQIDAARLQTILSFGAAFAGAANEQACFDTPQFESALATVFEPDVAFTVPYGIGTYTGITDVAEYLGMAFASLNHGYWLYDLTVDPTKPARLDVSTDGKVWHQGSTFGGSFMRGDQPYTDKYQEQEIAFEGCETKVQTFNVVPTPGLRDWVETFVQTADLSDRWGVQDICRYHTMFCANNPATRQYDSEQECLNYMNSLPLYSNACGINRPLAGNSVTCKFKHHFMIPTHPELHCPHIGKTGAVDPNNHFKCDDAAECSTNQGQNAWPAVQKIGANTPAAIIARYAASNAGAANEPLACALPSTTSGNPHAGH